MQKVLKSQLFYSFIALLFALLLFFNANSVNTSRITQSAQKYDITVYDVPVQIEYDQKKYYISGFPNTVTVHLSSINRVKLAQEASKETRSFKVIADLTNQKEGTIDVMLRATNLINGVEAVIDPAVISVTVEEKQTKKFKVVPTLDAAVLKEGYQVKSISLNHEYVEVTTGKETMSQIAKVQGKLSADRNISEDFKEEVLLQALDNKGNVLPVTIDPQRVVASVTILTPEKNVPVEFYETGRVNSGIKELQFQSTIKEVLAKGPQSSLDQLSTIKIPVDITGISEKKELFLPVATEDRQLSFNPKSIAVTATPIFEERQSSDGEKKTQKESSKNSQENKELESKETKEKEEQPSEKKGTTSSIESIRNESKISTGNKKE